MNTEFIHLLESLANGIVIADSDGRIVFTNRFLDEIFGYAHGDLLGQRIEILLPAELGDIHSRHRTEFNNSPETRLMGSGRDLMGRRKDGSVFPVEVGLSPISSSMGPRVVAIVTDITKRKHAEQRSSLQRDVALLLSQADRIESVAVDLLAAISGSLGWEVAALWLADADSKALVNAASWHKPGIAAPASQMQSMSLPPRKGEYLLVEVWQDGKPRWVPDLQAFTEYARLDAARAAGLHSALVLPINAGPQTGGVIEFFSRLVRKQDNDLIEVASAVASQIGQFMEGWRSRHALGVLQRQYLQSQKMESVGRLAGGIAHDFNNLLTIISISTDALLDRSTAGDDIRQIANEIAHATEQGATLIRQLMTFSKVQPQATRSVDVNELIRGLQRILGMLAGEDIQFKLQLHPEECHVMMESNKLEQVLMNLITNSRDAMPNGGVIGIGTDVIHADPATGRTVASLSSRKHLKLQISDSGHGIPAEIQPHIFDPFFSTKAEGKGTGLGLASVYGIVRQHDGHIDCESAPGEGTTFTVLLPLADRSGEARIHSPAAASSNRGSETILLVDDEPSLRMSIGRILEKNGHKVVVASNGREALQACAESADGFDLLVTDIVLPLMRGTELAALLLERFPRMRVLYMSGYNEENVPAARGLSFIAKPFRRDALVRKIREVLDSSS